VPIYEFYCADCHAIFSFLSRKASSKVPACPRCDRRRLERRVSTFAISKGRPEPTGDDLPEGLDEGRMESVMAEMAQDMERIDEHDPRAMAGFMRKFFDRSGMPLGPGIEEAIRRMESGEDPDKIEEEMGDLLDGEEHGLAPTGARGLSGLKRRLRAPEVDSTLHEL
jgi:putative FmdB family regulatory protein